MIDISKTVLPPKPTSAVEPEPGVEVEHLHGNVCNLKCPCGSTYLHQYRIDVFVRSGEDTVSVKTTVVVADADIRPPDDLPPQEKQHTNPSSRRDGLLVYFWCEACHGRYALGIAQHKGFTLVDWRKT